MEPVWNSSQEGSRPNRVRYEQRGEQWTFWKLVGAIALGGWIGAMAYTLTLAVFTKATVEYQMQELNASMKKELAADQQRRQRAAQEEADRRKAQNQQEADRQRLMREQTEAARKEAERREAAWQRFWQPSGQCRANPNTEQCANEHIKAKQRFDITYDAGLI